MGTHMCLAWCNMAGKGGHSQSGLGSTSLPVLWCQTASGQAIRLEERGSACRDLSACPWAKRILCWFSKHSGPRQMEMAVVSPFPLPFSWQKPMVGVSCALLTAVEFLPLASLSGTEIQGGSSSPAAASCECSSSAHGGAASPPGPAQGTGAAGFGLCAPAWLLEGCMEEGVFWQWLEIGFALGSSPGKLWFGFLLPTPALVPGREQTR